MTKQLPAAPASERDRLFGDLEHEVGVLVRRLKRVVGDRARAVHPDLTPAGYMMLTFIAAQGPVRPSDLVPKFALDKGAVSRHVQSLEDHGLVTKERDPSDGRAWVVSVPDDVRQRLRSVSAMRRERLGSKLGDWSEDDLRRFVESLGRYNAALE